MTDPAAHRAGVEAWREGRYAALLADMSWLTLAGLAWLKPGLNVVGAAEGVDVRLPGGPPRVGTIMLAHGLARADGDFALAGRPADGMELASDAGGEPTLLEVDRLRMCLIERGGRLAVRTWDLDSSARAAFAGIDHWPVEPRWRLDGHFEPTPDRSLTVPDVLGFDEEQESPGDVVFEVDGTQHRLQALRGGTSGKLWLVFADATNGVETYGGGRFLYTDVPDADGRIEVDFNRAYNPPCVFSPYATCPLPWPANRLPMRIEAGERMYVHPQDGERRRAAEAR